MVRPAPIEREKTFAEDEIIVSKTDTKGVITYGNELFIQMSGYEEEELLGKPHNLIRHPDMPRAVFKLLWDTLATGTEVFAYVKNLAKDGSYYWVLANVTCSYDLGGRVIGYHSVRRKPEKRVLEKVIPLYAAMLQAEKQGGMEAGGAVLGKLLKESGMAYEELVLSL
ncbi:MAG: PAS domain-containing protein [Campylobacterales bacterium]